MPMKLQLAFDFLQVPEIIRLVGQVADLIDLVEIGTPVIIRDGIQAVRQLRAAFPELALLADLKIMDGGEYEASLAFEAGADWATVLALADELTIAQAVKAARSYQAKIMVDMIGVADIGRKAAAVEALGASCVCVHTAIDVQHTGRNPLQELREIKGVLRKACAAVAGGVDACTIAEVSREQPDIVIVGGGITRQADPRAAALAIRRRMKP
jgi:3-hexulose-6-phosphate synthase